MTKNLTRRQVRHIRSLTTQWLTTIPAGYAPVVVIADGSMVPQAVCCDRNGRSIVTALDGTWGPGATGPASISVCFAAAVDSHGMAGYVWADTLATLPRKVQRAHAVLTERYRDGLDPVAGTKMVRRMLGER